MCAGRPWADLNSGIEPTLPFPVQRDGCAKKSMNIRRNSSRDLSAVPLLANGDNLPQSEFHRRYECYPEDVKFELVRGIVYIASPLAIDHGRFHATLSLVLELYSAETPGIQLLDNATTILGEDSEPQPDLSLRILPECGGQTQTFEKRYVQGGPELVAEVAHSTRAFDLHQKRDDYQRASVHEYLVFCLEEAELLWVDFAAKESITPDNKGVARSRVFPGLWINTNALLADDIKVLHATLKRGLKCPTHAAFVKKLGAKS